MKHFIKLIEKLLDNDYMPLVFLVIGVPLLIYGFNFISEKTADIGKGKITAQYELCMSSGFDKKQCYCKFYDCEFGE